MRGILRVIPSQASSLSHRCLILRQAATRPIIEDIVGGRLDIIENFKTILNQEGEPQPCLPFRARTGGDLSPNPLASWLRIQSQIRRDGFSGVDLHTAGPITGTVVVIYGDTEFLSSTAWACILYGEHLYLESKRATASLAKTPYRPISG